MAQRLDLVVFGASGFTGKYTVEEIHRIAKNDPSLTWGIAGRSQIKLEKIIKDLQEKTGDDLSKIKIFIADVKDEDSLKAMSSQAKVLVNCCGPYRFYGEPVVRACIDTVTHHVDVSGEPYYMELMQLQYNEAAQKAGVYIISACGFDCIPNDLGVVFLSQQFKGQVNSVESYMSFYNVGRSPRIGEAMVHYGTFESLVNGLAQQKDLRPLRTQLFTTRLPSLLPRLKPRSAIHKSSVDNQWHVPFPGADKLVVYRTQRFFYETEKKRPIQMYPYFGFSNFFMLLLTIFMMGIMKVMTLFECGKRLLLNNPRLFTLGAISHEGPSEEIMKSSKFTFNLIGKGWDESVKDIDSVKPNKTIHVKVCGTNPGYGATCTALVYSGIMILKERSKMPGKGGVLTPGAAFAKTSYIEVLNKNDLTFQVVSTKIE